MEEVPNQVIPLLVAAWVSALPRAAAAEDPGNVVLVVLDGVPRRDFYDRSLFPFLWSTLGAGGVYGNMRVSNRTRLSLPGYQALTVGTVTSCQSNECGRVQMETVLDRVAREIGEGRTSVAMITSWAP